MDARLQILETLYRFDLDESTHIRLIQETASRYWQKRGPVVLVGGRLMPDGGFELATPHVTRDDGRGYARAIRDILLNISTEELRACSAVTPVYGGARETGLKAKLSEQITMLFTRRAGVGDMLGFFSGTQEGGLVGLATFLNSLSSTSPRERAHWQPLAAHLAAAWRLRQRFDAGAAVEELTDAVFRPDGRISEARVRMHDSVRERLRELVRERERERSDRTASRGMWSELIDGHWTLVDHFESNGRRVVIALRNVPMGASLCRLTERELEALTQARNGAPNKEIGLRMNLSTSSVARLLRAVARKLNSTLADILQFTSADTIVCRDLLPGVSGLSVISKDLVGEWKHTLSDTESRLVSAVLRGRSNREIATMRGRSVRTVVNELAGVFEKLGVRSRREMVHRASGLTLEDSADGA